MNKQRINNLAVVAVTSVALVVFAVYVLIGLYSDVLLTAQDRNIFATDTLFVGETMAQPFGLFKYIGAFLTQFFYYPALGASLLIVVWLASVFAGIKAFRLKGMWRALMIIPVACLLASMVDLGYWIYCLNITGYWFSQSVAFLCLLLLLLAANSTPRKFRCGWYVIAFLLFPLLGWFSYIFAVCFALSQFERNGEVKTTPAWYDATGVILVLMAPVFFRLVMYGGIYVDEIYKAGFPFFETTTNSSLRPSIPFFVLAASLLVISLGKTLPQPKKMPAWAAYLVVGAVSAIGVCNVIFTDDNYRYEMRMTQAVLNNDWQGVIKVAEKTTTPSRTMVMLKNIALMNTGELGARSFELRNNGIEIKNPDSLYVNIMQIAAPVVYYNYGRINYAVRWSMGFGVSYGFSPYYLKLMANCAEASGEKELADRYAGRLNGFLFYRDWKPAQASPVVKELQSSYTDIIDSDDSRLEAYIMSVLSVPQKKDSQLITELSVFNSMLLSDVMQFSESLYSFAQKCDDDYLPQSYEEAYCLFVDKVPDAFPYRITISDATTQKYKSFQADCSRYAQYGHDQKSIGEMLKNEWGNTYWWYNAFAPKKY